MKYLATEDGVAVDLFDSMEDLVRILSQKYNDVTILEVYQVGRKVEESKYLKVVDRHKEKGRIAAAKQKVAELKEALRKAAADTKVKKIVETTDTSPEVIPANPNVAAKMMAENPPPSPKPYGIDSAFDVNKAFDYSDIPD